MELEEGFGDGDDALRAELKASVRKEVVNDQFMEASRAGCKEGWDQLFLFLLVGQV